MAGAAGQAVRPGAFEVHRSPRVGELGRGILIHRVTATAEQILEQLRALPAAERLRVAERIVHEVADEVTPLPTAAVVPLWANENDEDFEAFQNTLARLRIEDTWRTGDEPSAR
jgi:hypothetical protein